MTGYTLSFDFPVSQNAYQPVFGGVANAFLAILDLKASQAGAGLTYSTFYGGTGGEVAYDLKLDSAGHYYLCGYTLSRICRSRRTRSARIRVAPASTDLLP